MTGGPLTLLMRLVRLAQPLVERAFAPHHERYEPADHYMRGPGPKCREKTRNAG